MVRMSLRLPDEVSEKLRWIAYKKRCSQHSIVLDLLERELKKIKVPKEGRL